MNGRPGAMNFSYSPLLRDFTKATNIRLRFLRTNTLLGHLMGKALRDPTVTRRVSTPAGGHVGGPGHVGGSGPCGGSWWMGRAGVGATTLTARCTVLLQHQGHQHWRALRLPRPRRCV